MEIIRGILLNIAFLFAFLFIVNMLINSTRLSPKLKHLLQGTVFGIVTIGLMMNAWVMENGVIFDTRTVLIGTVSLFFSLPTALITSIIAIGFRIYIGGAGIYAGILSIVTALAMGLIWKHYILGKLKIKLHYELYLFGIAVHILMLASFLILNVLSSLEPLPFLLSSFFQLS